MAELVRQARLVRRLPISHDLARYIGADPHPRHASARGQGLATVDIDQTALSSAPLKVPSTRGPFLSSTMSAQICATETDDTRSSVVLTRPTSHLMPALSSPLPPARARTACPSRGTSSPRW